MKYKNNLKYFFSTSTICYIVNTTEQISYNAVFSYKIDFIQIILVNLIWGFGLMGTLIHFTLFFISKNFTEKNINKIESPSTE